MTSSSKARVLGFSIIALAAVIVTASVLNKDQINRSLRAEIAPCTSTCGSLELGTCACTADGRNELCCENPSGLCQVVSYACDSVNLCIPGDVISVYDITSDCTEMGGKLALGACCDGGSCSQKPSSTCVGRWHADQTCAQAAAGVPPATSDASCGTTCPPGKVITFSSTCLSPPTSPTIPPVSGLSCCDSFCGDNFWATNGADGAPGGGDDEECDDGNGVDNDTCSNTCKTTGCGNGGVPDADGLDDNPLTTADNEECDEGSLNNDSIADRCRTNCKKASCGDGVRDFLAPYEECDHGVYNGTAGDGCSAICKFAIVSTPICGNNVVETGEECDDGNFSNYDACLAITCKKAKCGDTFVSTTFIIGTGFEQCDDGNTINSDACINCQNARCGDSEQWLTSCLLPPIPSTAPCEECDPARPAQFLPSGCVIGQPDCVLEPACTSSCKLSKCGDGTVDAASPSYSGFPRLNIDGTSDDEQCDDGNMVDTDFCSNNCKNTTCGDGIKNGTEECDDANSIDTDACLNKCKKAKCGDGVLRPEGEDGVLGNLDDEKCDLGSSNGGACSLTCKIGDCGDGICFGASGESFATCPSDCPVSCLAPTTIADRGLCYVEGGACMSPYIGISKCCCDFSPPPTPPVALVLVTPTFTLPGIISAYIAPPASAPTVATEDSAMAAFIEMVRELFGF